MSVLINPYRFAAASPYIFREGFEGAGATHISTRSASGGSVDYDYSAAPLVGAQSMQVPPGSAAQGTFTGLTDVWAYCRFKTATLPSTATAFFNFRNAAITKMCGISISTTNWRIEANGTVGSTSAFGISPNTEYHLFLRFISGGTCEAYVSTTGIKPASDSGSGAKLIRTGAVGTADRIDFLAPATGGAIIIDEVIVSATTIPDNP